MYLPRSAMTRALAVLALVSLATGCDEVVAHFRIAAAKEDRLKNFDSFTPEQHYAAAIYVCQHDPNRPEVLTLSIDTDCVLRAGDFSRVIRHLEAIPKDSPVHEDAARALRLVKIQRDHPQDFEAAMKRTTKSASPRLRHGQDRVPVATTSMINAAFSNL